MADGNSNNATVSLDPWGDILNSIDMVNCKEARPTKYSGSAAEAGAPDPTSWSCPTCMLANKIADSKCVCCTVARPAKYSGMSGVAATLTIPVTTTSAPATWPCPTCTVENKITDAICVWCTETEIRPAKFSAMAGTSTTLAPCAPPAATGFTFGFSAQPTSTATTAFGLANSGITMMKAEIAELIGKLKLAESEKVLFLQQLAMEKSRNEDLEAESQSIIKAFQSENDQLTEQLRKFEAKVTKVESKLGVIHAELPD